MLYLLALTTLLTRTTDRIRTRLADDHGQTAAEYMGIIVVVAIILAAITASGIGEQISGYVGNAIDDVFNNAGGEG